MKKAHSFGMIFFCGIAILLFTNAQKISSRKLRVGFEWYLDQKVDTAAFFALDTLRFIDPTPGFFRVVTYTDGVSDRDEDLDTLNSYPTLLFHGKPKEEISLCNCGGNNLRGRFYLKRKTNTITIDFYKEKDDFPSDDLDDQIKFASIKYRILEFSKSKLVLLKIKNE